LEENQFGGARPFQDPLGGDHHGEKIKAEKAKRSGGEGEGEKDVSKDASKTHTAGKSLTPFWRFLGERIFGSKTKGG